MGSGGLLPRLGCGLGCKEAADGSFIMTDWIDKALGMTSGTGPPGRASMPPFARVWKRVVGRGVGMSCSRGFLDLRILKSSRDWVASFSPGIAPVTWCISCSGLRHFSDGASRGPS